MTVTVLSNFINLYLNAALIYGSEGIDLFFKESVPSLSILKEMWSWTHFPAMGVKGAALATLIASAWMAMHYALYLFSGDLIKRFKVFSFSFNKESITSESVNLFPLIVNNTSLEITFLVENRIKTTRKKIDNQNFQKLVKKRINITRSIINLNSSTQ